MYINVDVPNYIQSFFVRFNTLTKCFCKKRKYFRVSGFWF